MRLFDKMKHIAATAVAVLAIGAMATASVDVQAKTVDQPTETTKKVAVVGESEPVYGTNLKINGKKYTKGSIKKKVKTVVTSENEQQYQSYNGSYTEYLDSDMNYDREAARQQKQNFKYITTYSYQLTYLKAGTYKITYDTYSYGDDEVVKSADGKTQQVTPILKKTKHVINVKVLSDPNVTKQVSLGKSKRTWTTKRSGSKITTKTVVKNRYLTGKSGKLTIKMNKNYKLTSAFVTTRDAAGNIVVSATGNNKKVAYSTGKYAYSTIEYRYQYDAATGKNVYITDTTTGALRRVKAPVVVSDKAGAFKETTVYYGYKNKYTGDYLNYSVGTRTVYVPVLDAEGALVPQKDATGANLEDEKGNTLYTVTPVTATVITETYPAQDRVNGVWKTVVVVKEKVVLPTDKTLYDYSEYWLDATGSNCKYSGSWTEVSRDGIVKDRGAEKTNTSESLAYYMAFYDDSYGYGYVGEEEEWGCLAGNWVEYNDAMEYNTYDGNHIIYVYDDNWHFVKKYVYKYTLDTQGRKQILPDLLTDIEGYNGGCSDSETFNAK